MRPFDLIMFDLDGTLVETAPEIMDAVNDTLTRFDLSLVSQQQVNDWIGHGTLALLVQAVADRSGMTAEATRASDLLRQMVPVYDGFYQLRCGSRSHLYPQVRETPASNDATRYVPSVWPASCVVTPWHPGWARSGLASRSA